ncbi:hypothetical protein Ahy_A09g043986 isoform A [Arachis hypogaea]|uniref:Probable UDP-N-acetylglucosamine--peptide N-acetylglucosaminyltransferase SPINDLY n=1 Tax=Arachis hypogaea TaxID=3818 RepID=A0A445BJM7_ARAHY|nr:hypothetical protein Ahy_A09g043986 isoform A [Arachis hypogaea]
MISATGDNHRHHYHHHQPQHPGAVDASRPPIAGDRVEPFSVKQEPFSVKQEPGSLPLLRGHDSNEVDEDFHLSLAHQMYKAGNYKKALEHSNTVYERNPLRTDNLLLLGAVYYQLHDFDMCVAKNEEALRIEPHFAECYGNMANAWKEKGNIDLAIRYYLIAIELRPNFADAWSNLASAYMRKGRLTEAAQCCRQALAINPLMVDAHSNLGNLMKAQGLVQDSFFTSFRSWIHKLSYDTTLLMFFSARIPNIKLLSSSQNSDDGWSSCIPSPRLQIAYSCYLEALRIQPTFAIAWSNLAGLFMESGDLNRALQYYKEAVKLKPSFPDAYLNLGNVYKALGMPQEAIACYQQALQARPNYGMAYGNLASIFYEQGQLDMAILHYKQAVACDPRFLEAYNNLGNALKDVGRVEEAIQCYNQCLQLQPNHPQALTNLGNIYMEWNMVSAAAQYYKATLSVTTGLSAPYNNLAIIYKQQGSYADAISCYNEVLRIDPLAADGLVNRGNTYKEIGRVSEAIQDYIRAIAVRPTMAEAHANLASAYKDSGHVEAAIKSYRQALILRQDFPEATCNLLHTLQCVCSWEDRDQIRKYAAHCSLVASRLALPPFNHPAPIPIKREGGYERLRIGYVSSDFGNHPLSHLMGSVFGMHNRKNVEVFCYALSPNDGTEWRQRIQSEAEHFLDVSAMSSDMIAKMINESKIQVLVNLNGYTKGARNEIFAMQPAPIQVSYMGFPGTTGATYIDYVVTDEFVSPLQYAHIYSEKIVHLPHCYFVNDYKQKNLDVLDPNSPHKRSDYGLPEDKFIFACFNQLYKMDPEIFTTWCNILKRVPNSALWLLRFPAAGEMRLRQYAAAQGVQPDQIIFTDVAMKNEHIRRSSLADLFLDTPLCNAHTTGTDILWAGLPMVTLPLEKMATRVAGSLCLATGMDRAVSLALNRPKLQALTNKLKAVRMTCPLFDTARWVRNLDRAYFKMWNLHCGGQRPQHFKITENDLECPYDK